MFLAAFLASVNIFQANLLQPITSHQLGMWLPCQVLHTVGHASLWHLFYFISRVWMAFTLRWHLDVTLKQSSLK